MLRSTFTGFTTAQMGLQAAQTAIDIAGQNLTNMNTVGYTRQRLDVVSLSPTAPGFWAPTYDVGVGQGVQMIGISQIRDPYLDLQYRNQISKVGTADATDAILEDIGNIFDETDAEGIRAALNDVITQLNTMATTQNSSTGNIEAVVRSAMEVLMNQVYQKGTAIQDVKTDLISKMEDATIPNINTILDSITELNVSIKNSQILGQPALELQDQRNLLLDDLATYLPINAKITTNTSYGTAYEELTVTFTDTDGNVHTLISNDKSAEIAFDSTTEPQTVTIQDALTGTVSANLVDSFPNGVLKGELDMMNKSEVFDGSDVRGIGYYEKMFNSFVNELATTLNDLNATVDPATGAEIRNDLFETTSGTGPFTATNIKVSDKWMNGEVNLTLSKDPDAPSTDYSNILAMIQSLTSDEINVEIPNPDGSGTNISIYKGTVQDMYDTLQSVQSIDRKAASSLLSNHITVLNQISTSRMSISSVNQDEETMDLMKYQQSYNAASRIMTVMDELLDRLINQTGVVGR